MCNLETVLANACASGIGKIYNPIKLLQIIAQMLCDQIDGANCGTATNDILITGVTSGVNGHYAKTSAVLWTKYSPTAISAIRLVGTTWEIYPVGLPTVILFTITDAEFPCGTWIDHATGLPSALVAVYSSPV